MLGGGNRVLNKIELVEEEVSSSFPCNEKQCWEAIDTFTIMIIHSNYVAVIASPHGYNLLLLYSGNAVFIILWLYSNQT